MWFKKIIEYLIKNKKSLLRYFVVGFSGFLLDIGSLYILKRFFGLNAVIAVAVNQILVIGYIFSLNKLYSFDAREQTGSQLIKFLLLFGMNYLIAVVWMWGWHEKAGFHYLLVRAANIALSTLWNFILYKNWVYRVKNAEIKLK